MCFGLLATETSAQTLYGSIVGNVKDTSGATIPGATVTVINKGTTLTRDVATSDDGGYSVTNLLPGTYDVKVSLTGFREYVKQNVPVTAGTVARVDVALEVGQLSETVTVASPVQLMQTDKADSHTELKAKEITNLPLGGYRNYQALINLTPGATPAASQNAAIDTPGRALRTFVNGTATNNNVTRLDGATNINVWLPHHVAYVAPAETIESVNVTTSGFEADQGMAGGAATTVITKSGTNELRGSAFTNFENQDLKARAYFSATKPDSSRKISGGTLGGPILKNKLFYFGSYEGTREKGSRFDNYSVPNAALRSGDFSGFSTTIYDPSTGNADGTGRTPFAGNKIPASRISPIAQKLLGFLPAENTPTANSLRNYFNSGTQVLNRDQYDVKVNFNRSPAHQIWGKFSMMDATFTGQMALGAAGGPCVCDGSGSGVGDTKQYIVTIGQSWTLSPTMILDSTFGYSRMDQTVTGADYGTNFGLDTLGIPGTNGSDLRTSGMPQFDMGTSWTQLGNNQGWQPLFRNDRTYTFSTNLTKLVSHHTFRAGFDMVRFELNHWQPEIDNPRGRFAFNGGVTSLNGGASTNYLNQYAAFLLGMPSEIGKSIQYQLMTGREWQFAGYVSDRWELSSKVTASLGVRYEYYPLMQRADRGIETIDFAADRPYVLLGGVGDNPTDLGITTSKTLFSPRLGLAYRINEDTVFRTGYSRTFNPLPWSRPLRGFYPLTIAAITPAANSYTAAGSLATGIPAALLPDLSTGRIPLPNNVAMRYPAPGNTDRGHIDSWNMTLERKIPWDISVAAAYVGTASRDGYAYINTNAVQTPGTGNAGRVYFQQYGRTAATEEWGDYTRSNYHSFQLAVNRPFFNGLLLKGAYTYSKALNMTDEDGWVALTWNANDQVDRNYARAGYDRPNVVQAAFVYALPFGKDQSGIAAQLMKDWQVNGVYSWYNGAPFTVTASGTSLNADGNQQTADQLADINYTGVVGSGTYVDPTSFAPVTRVGYGTSGRNAARHPNQWNLDFGVFRGFQIKSRYRLEFRAEAFNLTNTPKFLVTTTSINDPNFGKLLSTTGVNSTGERQIRLGLRFQF
jgi:outer membrane receptor protein involved in Fe transport